MVPGNDWLLPDRGPDPSGGAPHWGNSGPMSAGQVLLPALPGNQPCWISFIDHFVCTKYAGYIAHVIIFFLWYRPQWYHNANLQITVEMKIWFFLSK